MRKVKSVFAMSAMLLAIHAYAEPAQDEPLQSALQDCDGDQMSMNLCAVQRRQQANEALNQQYEEMLATAVDDTARQRLRAAQRAGMVFRDQDCLSSVGLREEGGSMWPLLQADCLTRHIERRTEDLKLQACGMEGCAQP